MNMNIEYNITIPNVIKYIPDIYRDSRGEYVETWNKELYPQIDWMQDDISTSKYGVLRGLHGDFETYKLIQCLKGKIFVAIVDMRAQSESYLKHITYILDDVNRHQVLVPPGCANGHQVLSRDGCIFSYKQSTLYTGADKQFTVKWDDMSFNICWPIKDPILSLRDSQAKYI